MKIKTVEPSWAPNVPAQLRAALAAWFGLHARDLPWRRTRDPYSIMVSEFMLQQTQVITVIDFFQRWLVRFPTFQALAAAHEAQVLHAWQGLGYYSRARNLHRAAQLVVSDHGGQLPDDLAAIARLPGVGPYTAGAISSFAFDRATPAVDANIARVLARLLDFNAPIDSTPGNALIWQAARELLPKAHGCEHTSALMELGALVCLPRQPKCGSCPVHEWCLAKNPERLPVKKARRQTVRLAEDCAWIVEDERVLLQQQTGARWRGLWKLPELDGAGLGRPLVELEYPFTHHRVTLRVFSQAVPECLRSGQRWFTRASLEKEAAFASAHLRAVRALLAT